MRVVYATKLMVILLYKVDNIPCFHFSPPPNPPQSILQVAAVFQLNITPQDIPDYGLRGRTDSLLL